MSVSTEKLVLKFLSWAEQALTPASVNAYRHQLKNFVRHCRVSDVRRLTPADLTRWAKQWHEVQAVVRLFNWAVGEARILK